MEETREVTLGLRRKERGTGMEWVGDGKSDFQPFPGLGSGRQCHGCHGDVQTSTLLFPLFSGLNNVCCAFSLRLENLKPMPGMEYRCPRFRGWASVSQPDQRKIEYVGSSVCPSICLLHLLCTPAGWRLWTSSSGLLCPLAFRQPLGDTPGPGG